MLLFVQYQILMIVFDILNDFKAFPTGKALRMKEENNMNDEKLFHISVPVNFGAEYAILPGDPGRVDKIASLLDSPEFIAENREFRSVAGMLEGKKVIVTSTGIGGPSATIALEELYISGVRNMIRIGTCGGMQMDVIPGDLIIPTAAVRMEGTTREYAPVEFPAVADYDIISALISAVRKNGTPYHTGVIQSKDSFYGQHSPDTMPVAIVLKEKWKMWKKLGVLASEMEAAALFTVAQVRKIKAGCVLHALWNQERRDAGIIDPDSFDTMTAINTAVEALKILISNNG